MPPEAVHVIGDHQHLFVTGIDVEAPGCTMGNPMSQGFEVGGPGREQASDL